MRIEAEGVVTHELIQSLHMDEKCICWRIQSRKLHDTLSKALWKSSFRIIDLDLSLLHDSITSAKKPICCGQNWAYRCGFGPHQMSPHQLTKKI